MKYFKCVFIILFSLGFCDKSLAQEIKKNIVVEHFTNTRCSACASSNPGFYSAKNQRPDVLHIAYHPSVPYSTCLFNTQNKSENDARTMYYNVFFGTPTYFINGEFKSSSRMQNANVYDSFQTQTTPMSVNVSFMPTHEDSIKVVVTVEALAQHNIGLLSLYVPLLEDTVFYNAPNGENSHFDVFRKSFSGDNSITFMAPLFGAPAYSFSSTIVKNNLWDLNRLSALGIVSNGLAVIQAQQSPKYSTNFSLPLDWEDVDVKSVKDGHEITWSTTNEINVSHFEVERRLANDKEFNAIPGIVNAARVLKDRNQYSLVDYDTDKPGIYIYRVKQVDYDGKFTYSKAVKVTNNGNYSIEIYPNPAKDEFNLYLKVDYDSKVEIKIFDSLGKTVAIFKTSEIDKSSENVFNVKLWDNPSGPYIADININGFSFKKKIVKL